MSRKTITRIGWGLSFVLALLFGMSAFMKLMPNETTIAQAAGIGFDATTYQMIGVVETLALILFLIPRTGVVGSLLLIAYMGGAIATHLQNQQPIGTAVAVESLVWVALAMRYPEVLSRLFPNSRVSARLETVS